MTAIRTESRLRRILRLIPGSWKERVKRRAGAITLLGRLENLQRAGFRPRKIIDAGAFMGDWSQAALQVFPEASFLMIEAQPQLAPRLRQLVARTPRMAFRSALIGSEKSRAKFLIAESNSRIVPAAHAAAPDEQIEELPTETLATLAADHGFTDCDFLKLDLQGAELEALAGAGALFGTAEVVLIEVSWLRIGGVPLIGEVCQAFADRGYRLYDILGFNYRPLDRALWQSDLLFVRRDSGLLAREHVWA